MLFNQFLENLSLLRLHIHHKTYHHFTGEGLYDSEIDVILHSARLGQCEQIKSVRCKLDHPDMLSHHDMLLSECSIPALPVASNPSEQLLSAPRMNNSREKIVWSADGAAEYEGLVTPALSSLRESWLQPSCKASMYVLLQLTNYALTNAASATNKAISLAVKTRNKIAHKPKQILIATQKLRRAHKKWKQSTDSSHGIALAKSTYKSALKSYKTAVRTVRLNGESNQDSKLLTILSDDPSSLYTFIRSSKGSSQTKIEKLSVKNKVYFGDRVPDGFYDTMTSLKSCDPTELLSNPPVAEQLSNYDHISKLCEESRPLPLISQKVAASLLSRLKKNVKDFYSVTALHYLNAGDEGLAHFQELLNAIITEVDNATIVELNVAHGIILYKGHKKEKTSERSYRTISTCPFLSKALDLYIRDLYQDQWNDCQASTQYQGSGSSHELASLLVTEVIQHSLYVANKPVFMLALDAESAFDRCLRQILVCELFKAGMKDDALKLIDNRLKSRSTVYEWDKELLGPAPDTTGFEQGAINSSDFYKLYNNQQLDTAQSSNLGVNLDSVVISAIGQADDVILCSNDIDCLRLLVTLTENYCQKYRVKLVPSKTKLLAYCTQKMQHHVDLAKLINPVTINDQPVKFTSEVEHVGVLRNTAGNMPHIMNRIVEHKSGLSFVLSAGLARGRHGNPAASLKVHDLYGTPKLFSGLASLVLSKAEVAVIDNHYQRTIMNLQRLHDRTPRSFVFLLAGCLPGEAILHLKQLTLFMMVCHLPHDPLNIHARHCLLFNKSTTSSWFQGIRALCLQYGLNHPLQLLASPPSKSSFKTLVKERVTSYWERLLQDEAADLSSLSYFALRNHSLNTPSLIWSTATSSSFECRKASIMARMVSGRFRTEYMARHWSSNKLGYCMAETCLQTIGSLQHLLIDCPALSDVRQRMWTMIFDKTVQYPALFQFLLELEKSSPELQMQFFLDPTAIPAILEVWELFGQQAVDHVYYLARTYVYYLYRKKQILMGFWRTDNFKIKSKKVKKQKCNLNVESPTNSLPIPGNQADDVLWTVPVLPVLTEHAVRHPETWPLVLHGALHGGPTGTRCCDGGQACNVCKDLVCNFNLIETQSVIPTKQLLISNNYSYINLQYGHDQLFIPEEGGGSHLGVTIATNTPL